MAAAFIMTTTSCELWLLKCALAAVTGWACGAAVTGGQSARSGLNLFNELACSCWPYQVNHLLRSREQTHGALGRDSSKQKTAQIEEEAVAWSCTFKLLRGFMVLHYGCCKTEETQVQQFLQSKFFPFACSMSKCPCATILKKKNAQKGEFFWIGYCDKAQYSRESGQRRLQTLFTCCWFFAEIQTAWFLFVCLFLHVKFFKKFSFIWVVFLWLEEEERGIWMIRLILVTLM